MITEDYVSFETAKLLKEKGFGEEVLTYYVYDTESKSYEFRFDDRWDNPNNFPGDCISAPTLQMAMKWLREVHSRYIEIYIDNSHNFKDIVFRPAIYDKELDCLWESDNFLTYEKACETAIKYCIKNFI